MSAHPLGVVLGSILNGVSEAQFLSDIYTGELKQAYSDDAGLNQLQIPNTVFKAVRLDLRFAIARVCSPDSSDADGPTPDPSLEVLVDKHELDDLQDWQVSRLEIELLVDDVEVLNTAIEST